MKINRKQKKSTTMIRVLEQKNIATNIYILYF